MINVESLKDLMEGIGGSIEVLKTAEIYIIDGMCKKFYTPLGLTKKICNTFLCRIQYGEETDIEEIHEKHGTLQEICLSWRKIDGQYFPTMVIGQARWAQIDSMDESWGSVEELKTLLINL